MNITVSKYYELEAKFNTFTKAVAMLNEKGFKGFESVVEVVYEDELPAFVKAIEEGEESFIKFIENENR